jgi:hypothetical protein
MALLYLERMIVALFSFGKILQANQNDCSTKANTRYKMSVAILL